MHARGFREQANVRSVLLVDPEREAYTAIGLHRGVGRTLFSLKGAGKALGALREGHRQGATQGDNWQQGGELVIGPGDEVLFLHRSAHTGDHAPPEQILEALRSAKG